VGRTGLVHGTLTGEETARLRQRCHREDTTVTGALGAALLRAAARHRVTGRFPGTLLGTAIDLRPPTHLSGSASTSACFAARPFFGISRADFWELARQVRRWHAVTLRQRAYPLNTSALAAVLGWLPGRGRAAWWRFSRQLTVVISNVGIVDAAPMEPASHVISASFAAPPMAARLFAAVATSGACLSVNLTFTECDVSRETAQLIANTVLADLRSA
jgi:hypothetical protein